MKRNLFCLFLLIGIFFNTNVLAQPELDTTFLGTGKAILQFGTLGAASDAVIQPDNKIVMFGGCNNFNAFPSPLCLIRLKENGSFDNTFNGILNGMTTNGYVITRVPGINSNYSMGGTGIALQNDGKLVAVGFGTFSGQKRIILARFNSNGSLDASFGTDGISINAIVGNSESRKMVIQPDGKILVVGFSDLSPGFQQFVARYLPDGNLDSSFGIGGIVTISIPANSTTGLSIALQNDGKILTGGSMMSSVTESSYLLTRLDYDGSLDTTFDEDGLKSVASNTSLYNTNGYISIAVQTDGRILALGDKNILYRFNPNGSLDTSFSSGGSRFALNGSSDSYGLMVTASGKITVVGNTKLPDIGGAPIFYHVARYLPDGSPNTNFSDDGFLDIDVGNQSQDGALVVKPDSQGRTVIAGRSAVGTVLNPWENSQFSVARLIASPTQNVGFTGRVTKSDGTPVFNAFITLQNGAEIIGIARTNPFGYFRFKNVQSNQTYTLSTRSKGLFFNDRSVLVDDAITNYTIISEGLPILIQGK